MTLVWKKSIDLIEYPDALVTMMGLVSHVEQEKQETVWLLEHPPLYTAGTSAREEEVLSPSSFPIYKTGRGGRYTYHGPGQRIAYAVLDLNQRQRDVRTYINSLENWLISSLAHFGIQGETHPDRVGIWVSTSQGEKKIAAIGVRISKWITQHGIALNVHPNLEHFKGIIPCGLSQFGITSMHDLGVKISLEEVDSILMNEWKKNSFLNPVDF